MTFKESLSLIRRRLLEKSNLIFLFVLIFLIFIIYGCVIVMNFSFDAKKNYFNGDLSNRTIITNMPSNEVSELANVEYYTSNKYASEVPIDVAEFNVSKEDGSIYLKALLTPNNIEIVHGENIKKVGEVICPERFYPHNVDKQIDNSLYLKGKDIISKTFKAPSYNEDRLGENITFKIVGTYKNKPFVESNTCYGNESSIDLVKSKYSYITSGGDSTTGEENVVYHEYKGTLIIVDDYKNVSNVAKIIESACYTTDTSQMDESLFKYLFYIPLFISIIVLIISHNIIYNYVQKKGKERSHYLGILKSLGYLDEDIIRMEVVENIILTIIGMVIAFVFLIIAYLIISKVFLAQFIFVNYYIPIPVIYLILTSILVILIVFFFSKLKTKKVLKTNITELLKSEVLS